MSSGSPRILAVGDPFVPDEVFREALGALPSASVRTIQLADAYHPEPAPDGGMRVGEYVGAPDALIAEIADAEVLLVHAAPVTSAVLEAADDLRVIGCARGGPINIDVAAATSRGISVLRAPGRNAGAVAELTLCLMIALARHLKPAMSRAETDPELGASVIEGARFLGSELVGRTVGLVGLGKVGRLVARLGDAFGMTVVGFDPFVDERELAETPVTPQPLSELLAVSDLVSLHARATPETENLIGRAELETMREGALLVNTARETLVDEDALLDALVSGHLGGAALDVIRPRGNGRSPLRDRDDVIVLPHIGGATREAGLNGVAILVDAIDRLLSGQSVDSLVNPEAGATARPAASGEVSSDP